MVRQTSVRGVYSKVGDPNVKRDPADFRPYLLLGCIVALVFFFLASPTRSHGGPANNDNLRSGQARHNITQANFKPSSREKDQNDDNYRSSAVASPMYEAAVRDVEDAENQELQKEQSTLNAAVTTAGSYTWSSLKKLKGKGNLKEEDLRQIKNEIETRLSQNITAELRKKADFYTKEKEEELGVIVSEEGRGSDGKMMGQDVSEAEGEAIGSLREQIDETSIELQKSMPQRAQEIEKEILEERLSKRLGKKVKLVIVDEELEGFDELFEGLDNLGNGKTESRTGSTKSQSTSSQTTSSKRKKEGSSRVKKDDDDETGNRQKSSRVSNDDNGDTEKAGSKEESDNEDAGNGDDGV